MRAPARRAAHGRPLHGARRAAAACASGGGVGRLGRGRARATGGLEQRLAGPRLGGSPAPVGPKLRPSRSAHRPASARQAAAQRGVVEEGAVLRVVVGHESAPMARRACSAHRVRSRSSGWVPRRARGDPGRRSLAGVTRGPAHASLPQRPSAPAAAARQLRILGFREREFKLERLKANLTHLVCEVLT